MKASFRRRDRTALPRWSLHSSFWPPSASCGSCCSRLSARTLAWRVEPARQAHPLLPRHLAVASRRVYETKWPGA